MGKYTVLDDPVVDQLVDGHLERIVRAITARTSPQSIILYGSLPRGEASVIVERGQVHMLSDYEIKVIGQSPRLRSLCKALSREMTARLGVSVGMGWMRPDRLRTGRSSNLSFGPALPSIFMYELRSAGQTLYGDDLLSSSPLVDPGTIPLSSGIVLLLNRMAESLQYLPCSSASSHFGELEKVIWINKAILACAEALLLSAGCYHYSYRERGRRFAAIVHDNFAPLVAKAPAMPDLVRRATEFKLRPDVALYSRDVAETWAEAATAIDTTFRYLVRLQHGRSFRTYDEFPAQYLSLCQDKRNGSFPMNATVGLLGRKLAEGVIHLEHRHWPPPVFFTRYSPSELVYALVPVLFQSCFGGGRSTMVNVVRRWLRLLGKLEPQQPDPCLEWDYLRQRLAWNWKVFCY